jgi:hypothetical protein
MKRRQSHKNLELDGGESSAAAEEKNQRIRKVTKTGQLAITSWSATGQIV